jgi:hypothetical protein
MFNRNDLTIAVTTEGHVYVAQGNPAANRLDADYDIADEEWGLYFSQLAHRCAFIDSDGEYRVGTPTTAKAEAMAGTRFVSFPYRLPSCVGTPTFIGRLSRDLPG